MISISALSCKFHPSLFYPWLTNKLTAFSDLFSRYPVLQSISTYHSLIGAVLCVYAVYVNPVRVSRHPSLSFNFPHVLSVSCDCLAPPHFPESSHRMFYSPVYLSLHISVAPCEFVICVTFIPVFCYFVYLFPEIRFLCVSLIPAFLLPGVLQFPVSLVICFPVGFLSVHCLASLWSLPPVVSSPHVF